MILAVLCSATTSAQETPFASLLEQRQSGVVIQKWDLSCGAAALATILNFQHGESFSEREIAAMLIDRPEYLAHPWIIRARHGFSLLDLKRVSERLGYRGIGLGGLSIEDLDQRAPIIVPVDLSGYPHFVIYRGRSGDEVVLADPAYGMRTMPLKRFEQALMIDPELGHLGFTVLSHQTQQGRAAAQLTNDQFLVAQP
ncbi:C39 family peptidase [Altererythrobacter sp. MF3-039]|uniref:C39 family peptidase n=1 Tax=Altererythrobacter sp. MF3-039 TaxID=3252901 RepID=UPI00390CCA31